MSTHLPTKARSAAKPPGFCRGSARVEGLPIILVFVMLVGFFMVAAPEVFLGWPIYLSFLTTVPPMLVLSIGLTHRRRGRRDRPVLPLDPRLRRLPVLVLRDAAGHARGSAWRPPSPAARLIGVVNGVLGRRRRHPLHHRHHRHAVLLGGSGVHPFRRHVRRVAGTARQRDLQRSSPATSSASARCRRSGRSALAIFMWFILNRHRFGEHVLFIGDSRRWRGSRASMSCGRR